MDQQRQQLAEAVRLVNGVIETLDDPAFALTMRAVDQLEDAWMNWCKTDRKILRTWLKVAKDDIRDALEALEAKT